MKTDNIKIDPAWSQSKDEIWSEKFADLEEERMTFRRRNPLLFYAAVAAIALLILPVTGFLYTKDVTAPRGEHLSMILPDGSKVELNADSKLSYNPLWWTVSRKVKLWGEAYFEVNKGRQFVVESQRASVRVLGTSFNVYARENKYSVTCFTGKVEVFDTESQVILTSYLQASYNGRALIAQNVESSMNAASWRDNKFIFNTVPLSQVIAEIERQYNIKVAMPPNSDYIYSGNFTKSESPQQVLEIVGKPFGLTLKIQ